jgi:hypothetical protein
LDIGAITTTLETITSKNQDIGEILVHIPSDLGDVTAEECPAVEEQIEGANHGTRWSDLDRLLVKFRESHSSRVMVTYREPQTSEGVRGIKDWAAYLLPEVTRRGIADMVEERLGPDNRYQLLS